MDRPPSRRRAALDVLLLALAGVSGLLACAGSVRDGARAPAAPRQGWSKSRGPVLPHDRFPTDCSLCHVSTSWREIRPDFAFDHEKETGVALEGAHAQAECLRCHNDRGPVEVFAQRGCAGCHEDPHRGKLGVGCEDCHDERAWTPREPIARHNRTRFPLVGAHVAVACFRCHPGSEVGNFDRTPIDCVACHADDLAGATSPDHAAQGWVTGCERCHIPTTWRGAGFDHSGFPLTGAHATIACEQCHVGGVYTGLPTACVACHLDDYNATTRPNHVAAGFPTTCESCHNTSSWEGASFNHPFPIGSGPHSGPGACAQCHPRPGNFRTFSCTGCHGQAQTDKHHNEVAGYAYNSPACYACHPNG